MALYSAMVCRIDGVLLFENQEVGIDYPNNDTDVDTIPGGAVGVSPGADKCEVTLNNVLPLPGAEFDFVKAKINRTELSVELFNIGGNFKLNGVFLVRSCQVGSGIGSPTTINATLQSIGKVPTPA